MKTIYSEKFLHDYPGWMEIQSESDPLHSIFEVFGTQAVFTEKVAQHYTDNSFFPTADADNLSTYYAYILASGEFGNNMIISGYYPVADLTGEISLRYVGPSDPDDYYPTRGMALDYEYQPIGKIMGLCYIDDVMSGQYYISVKDDPSVYYFNDDLSLTSSGVYCEATATFFLEFLNVSGELYSANLYHIPMSYEFVDVYTGAVPSLSVRDDHAYIMLDPLQQLGRIQATIKYRVCAWPHRIITDQYKWQYFHTSTQPDLLLANEVSMSGQLCSPCWNPVSGSAEGTYLVWQEIPFEFSETISGGYTYFRCDPLDLLPYDVAKVEFDYVEFHHIEDTLDGNFHIHDDRILSESIRCFTEVANNRPPAYYNATVDSLFGVPGNGSIPVYPVDFSGLYYPDDAYIYGLAGDYHVTYSTTETKVYYPQGKPSHPIYPRTDFRWNQDYKIKGGQIYPYTILELRDCDTNLNYQLTSSLLSSFRVYAPIYYSGSAYDIGTGYMVFINHKGLLMKEDGQKWFIRYPKETTYTPILNTQAKTSFGGQSADLKELISFEPNDDITFRSMVNFKDRILLLGEFCRELALYILDPLDLPDVQYKAVIENVDNVIGS